ncbi:hypothetical protein M9H77_16613 [Catharanthus roseus]|uniref:Uncharacterized protein n=1 Tax=Catharanthus roseus TaxID=4058 RepID=A0ACC0B291_CATRO|nr:hypothetical protein M9H77_16613 [Catharanthus roseus]
MTMLIEVRIARRTSIGDVGGRGVNRSRSSGYSQTHTQTLRVKHEPRPRLRLSGYKIYGPRPDPLGFRECASLGKVDPQDTIQYALAYFHEFSTGKISIQSTGVDSGCKETPWQPLEERWYKVIVDGAEGKGGVWVVIWDLGRPFGGDGGLVWHVNWE